MADSLRGQTAWDSFVANSSKYISLGTRKKDGSIVRTPVWYVSRDLGKAGSELYVTTEDNSGKVKRIRNFSDVEIAECDIRGRIKGEEISAVANIADAHQANELTELFREKYGLMFRFMSLRGRKSLQRVFIHIHQTNGDPNPDAGHE
jgi:PPOX class probable F420-dependent enzyme